MRFPARNASVRVSRLLLVVLALAVPSVAGAEQAAPSPGPAPPRKGEPPGTGSLAAEIRALRERVEVLERTLTGLLEVFPAVASGVVIVPPVARKLDDPIADPLGFARLQPGQVTIRHGLGAGEVTVHLAVVTPEGRVSYQVPSGALSAAAPAPPDGTFAIFNATEGPLTVRWWAILHPTPATGAPGQGTP